MINSTQQLAALIRHKHQLLAQLCDVVRRQQELVDGGDWTALMKLLSVKTPLLEALQQIERGLAPYHEDDPERRIWDSADERRECRRLADECGPLLEHLMRAERESEALLIRRRDEAAARLQGLHTASTACDGYAEAYSATSLGAMSVGETC